MLSGTRLFSVDNFVLRTHRLVSYFLLYTNECAWEGKGTGFESNQNFLQTVKIQAQLSDRDIFYISCEKCYLSCY